MTVKSLSDPIKEDIARLLEGVTLGEDVSFEANIALQPSPEGMIPMVGVILIVPSGILGQEIIGAALMALGAAQNEALLTDHLRNMWSNLMDQRSRLLANPLDPGGPGIILPPNGNGP